MLSGVNLAGTRFKIQDAGQYAEWGELGWYKIQDSRFKILDSRFKMPGNMLSGVNLAGARFRAPKKHRSSESCIPVKHSPVGHGAEFTPTP
jgi:hypothetical protein